MRAKIDINEVETRTKIRAKYLRAIENEEWGLLPGDVYAKSFLRTYADYLGLDSRQLIDDYSAATSARPTTRCGRSPPWAASATAGIEESAPRRLPRQPRGPLIPPWVLIGVVLVAIVVALYFVGSTRATATPTTSTPTQPRPRPPRRPAHRHHRRQGAHGRPATVKLQLVPTGAVYVCLVNGARQAPDPRADLQRRPDDPDQDLVQAAADARQRLGEDEGQRRHRAGARRPASPIGFDLTPATHTLLPAGKQPQCA